MTKLTNKSIRFIWHHIVDLKDDTTSLAAKRHDVSERRIRQLTRSYRETGRYPTLNPNRRPKGPPLSEEEKVIINEFWEEKRLGATLLWRELKKAGYRIPHNKVNAYLNKTGEFSNAGIGENWTGVYIPGPRLGLYQPEQLPQPSFRPGLGNPRSDRRSRQLGLL